MADTVVSDAPAYKEVAVAFITSARDPMTWSFHSEIVLKCLDENEGTGIPFVCESSLDADGINYWAIPSVPSHSQRADRKVAQPVDSTLQQAF